MAPALLIILWAFCGPAAGQDQIVVLTPQQPQDFASVPYLKARLDLPADLLGPDARAIWIRCPQGGPTMLYELPPPVGGRIAMDVLLPAFWPHQQYLLRVLKGPDPNATTSSHSQTWMDWPAGAVERSGFLDPDLYRRCENYPADWPASYRVGVFVASGIYIAMLAGLGLMGNPLVRKVGMGAVLLAGIAAVWISLRSQPAVISRTVRAGPEALDSSPADPPANQALLLAARRTREILVPGPLWAPLYADSLQARDDSTVVQPGRGMWTRVEPGRARLFADVPSSQNGP